MRVDMATDDEFTAQPRTISPIRIPDDLPAAGLSTRAVISS